MKDERVAMKLERARDHLSLSAHASIVETGAPANHRIRRDPRDRRQDRRGGCAVRDSHLADADQSRAAASEVVRHFDSNFERPRRFVRRHRGAAREVGGPGADPSIGHACQGRGAGVDLHADVDHLQHVAEAARKHADRGATSRDVSQHLGGHSLRIRADAFVGDPMITDEDRNRAASHMRRAVAPNCSIATHDFLEVAEAPNRLGERVQAFAGDSPGLIVERRNCRDGVLQH